MQYLLQEEGLSFGRGNLTTDGKHEFVLSFNMDRNSRILLYLASVDNLHKKSKKKKITNQTLEHTKQPKK